MDICQYQKCSVRLRHQCFRVTHLFVVASSVLLGSGLFRVVLPLVLLTSSMPLLSS